MKRGSGRAWGLLAAAVLLLALPVQGQQKEDGGMGFSIENDCARLEISADGTLRSLTDRASGKDYSKKPGGPFSSVTVGGKVTGSTSAAGSGGVLTLKFADTGISLRMAVEPKEEYFAFRVVAVDGGNPDAVAIFDLPLILTRSLDEPFAVCVLALDLQTHVPELPGPGTTARALCYPRFGFAGAEAALIACPTARLRETMQKAVQAAPELPHSRIGGPWALDDAGNYGSYLFNFDGITLETVDEWIGLARSLGFTQIDFHGGSSFRFGDCRPNPARYPNGRADLKAVIDRLHEAGIKAGLHPYAHFIDKTCPWVTPIPHEGLAKDATFTLSQDIPTDAGTIPVEESTEAMSTTTGFFVRNSVTLQVDDELIIYSGISKEPPYAFTGIQRGAHGTQPVPHSKGAKVHHLKECFGLFAPDGDSRLLDEVAGSIAETFNECGFDMIYLDALDGEDVLGGVENSWHYGSKFVFKIWEKLKRPALQEMSTFHHHLWFVRSRMGAWDHPSRSHRKFIDIHCAANRANATMFLPGHLGWWALKPGASADTERTYPEDIEYLCCKAIGTGDGFSIMGVDPQSIKSNTALARLAEIIRRYETLRGKGVFPDKVKERLREPDRDFVLDDSDPARPVLRPATYERHKFESYDERTKNWDVPNEFAEQPAVFRIEALWSAGPYDSPEAVILEDFQNADRFKVTGSAPGVQARIEKAESAAGGRKVAGNYIAESERSATPAEAGFSPTEHGVRTGNSGALWSQASKRYEPALALGNRKAAGVWIHGDGRGEVLNFQVQSPHHVSRGYGDHYVPVDFEGWRYFELVEAEGEKAEQYGWPYANDVYAMYRELVNYDQVGSFSIWYGNLPQGKVACGFREVQALPLVANRLTNPEITINGSRVRFDCEIASGGYLEYRGPEDCKLYGADGQFIRDVEAGSGRPVLRNGKNKLEFDCGGGDGISKRAWITVMAAGDPLE